MIPRSDMISLPINAEFNQVKSIIFQTGYTRIAIYEDNLDNIRGFIHIKDIISYFDDKEILSKNKKKYQ